MKVTNSIQLNNNNAVSFNKQAQKVSCAKNNEISFGHILSEDNEEIPSILKKLFSPKYNEQSKEVKANLQSASEDIIKIINPKSTSDNMFDFWYGPSKYKNHSVAFNGKNKKKLDITA